MMPKTARRGVFLSLDSIAAMLLLFVVVLVAFSYIWAPKNSAFDSLLLRAYAQDAATVMQKKGYLVAPLVSPNSTGTSGISEVLRASPAAVCMQVSAHGTAVPAGLVGYWKFEEDSGTSAADSSGYGNTGVLNGTAGAIPQFVEGGRSGRAVLITTSSNSSGPYVYVPYSSTLQPSRITVATWAYTSDWASYTNKSSIVSDAEASGFTLSVNDWYDQAITFAAFPVGAGWYTDASWSGRNSLSSGWHFFAGTYDGTSVRLYVDGQLKATAATGLSNAPLYYKYSNALMIGADGSTGTVPLDGHFFNGAIDEVRVYSRALSADEISQIYRDPPNLLYSVDKPECSYSGGEIQSITVPFAYSKDQNENNYYYAVVKSWLKGTRE